MLAPVACSCLKRTSLMREPGSSSLSAKQQAAAGAAAVRVLAVPLGLADVGAEARRAARAARQPCPA